ncbi:MAG: hypothetical protein Q4E31_13575, partial [Intestinibacter bartlettii]|uniref:hypothetical protein n=1 Tax=Intestinibacter bartlettii TaxID=261299 RepID=UPI0026F58A0F|nr:hypothetical protein [Intestinibacter bartlettii]
MNDSLYEDYMRSVLGYQGINNYPNTYNMNYDNYERYDSYTMPTMAPMASNQPMSAMSNIQMQELENCYPDIYRIVYPMVQKACEQNTRPITRELIDIMTNEIYSVIEDNELTQTRGKEENKIKDEKTTNTRSDDRQPIRNQGLNDLIRILLLRELLLRPGFPGFRPPRPPRPPMRP